MRFLPLVALVVIPNVALADCYYDPVKGEIVCVHTPISGPDGGWFNKKLLEVLAHREWAVPQVRIDKPLDARDKEILRQWSEEQRRQLERFRGRLEDNRGILPPANLEKGMTLYQDGIENYRLMIREAE